MMLLPLLLTLILMVALMFRTSAHNVSCRAHPSPWPARMHTDIVPWYRWLHLGGRGGWPFPSTDRLLGVAGVVVVVVLPREGSTARRPLPPPAVM